MPNLDLVFARRRWPLAVALALTLALAAWPSISQAQRSQAQRSQAHRTQAHRGKAGPGRAAAARAAAARASKPAPSLTGKVVVFPFQDDDDRSVAAQIERLLRARGFEIVTGVHPVDTAEQYRELATTLGLTALVGGSYAEGEKNARLTVLVRSGYTGRRVAAVTFKESRFDLRAHVEDQLWTRIGPAMTRACSDAGKPRKRGRGPLVIEAGTPLASSGDSSAH